MTNPVRRRFVSLLKKGGIIRARSFGTSSPGAWVDVVQLADGTFARRTVHPSGNADGPSVLLERLG